MNSTHKHRDYSRDSNHHNRTARLQFLTSYQPYLDGTSGRLDGSTGMDGKNMERNERLHREAESLWAALSAEPPPNGLRGARLLDAALHLKDAGAYDRLYSPHLRPTQITRPR